VKVVVLTTSYPRFAGDAAGRFIADAVRHVRQARVEVEVVSPATFRHFAVAYGSGIVGNLRSQPARAAALPAFMASFSSAARRAARDADLVHAHWLPSGLAAISAGKPFVLQLWGTDVELARRARPFARSIVRRARIVVCASTALAKEADALGAREVRIIPSGVDLPAEVGAEAAPPEVLYVGRLSPEKGVLDLVMAADGMKLVVAGDGPLRERVPGALGFVPHHELSPLYARAAVVACPSRREGFGVACAEAMAHGRPVVASAVGGLLDLVVDGETGVLVPQGDIGRLRAALECLLGDEDLRRKLGAAARERAEELLSWDRVTAATLAAYEDLRRYAAAAS
jgi:glycosyltransferase involved in cell wall biosynthesis